MIEGIPLVLLNGLGVTGLLVFIFFMVSTGKAPTPQVLKDKNEEIAWLRKTNEKQAELLQTLTAERLALIQTRAERNKAR